jgi:hypothetical protein
MADGDERRAGHDDVVHRLVDLVPGRLGVGDQARPVDAVGLRVDHRVVVPVHDRAAEDARHLRDREPADERAQRAARQVLHGDERRVLVPGSASGPHASWM